MRIERWKKRQAGVDSPDFLSGLLCIQTQPSAPFPRTLPCLLTPIRAAVGKPDVVAPTLGKLIPRHYLEIVQHFEQGIIRDILVGEGVHAEQVLMSMDTTQSEAAAILPGDVQGKRRALRRIDAEFAGSPFPRRTETPTASTTTPAPSARAAASPSMPYWRACTPTTDIAVAEICLGARIEYLLSPVKGAFQEAMREL